MTENINWAKAVKDRDTCCQRCGSTSRLEAHHVETLEELMVRLDLKTRGDCRAHSKIIWAMSNGITLCRHCHFRHHNRGFSMKIDQSTFEKMPDHIRQMFVPLPDPVVAMFPDSKGQQGAVRGDEPSGGAKDIYGKFNGRPPAPVRGDSGSAARFFHQFPHTEAEGVGIDPLFYHAKAGKSDRAGSVHPTVKPIALMQYLIRHITPPGGVILDPFAGSGTTAEAAKREGFDCILMEAESEYIEFLESRFNLRRSTDLTDLLS